MRMFTNDRRPIYIAASGGNVGEGVFDMLIMHKPPEQDQEIIEWLRAENERLRDALNVLANPEMYHKIGWINLVHQDGAIQAHEYARAVLDFRKDADGHGGAVPLRDGEE